MTVTRSGDRSHAPASHAASDGSTASMPPHDPLYRLLRAILFELDAERAHDLALAALDRPALRRWFALPAADARGEPVECMGLRFPNRVGLAAGLDKHADHLDALGALGFGAIEVGTVTPRPQPGNARPRLFRLPNHHALINRFGFNSHGVAHMAARLERRRFAGIVGVNIGKNAATTIEDAAGDYVACLERLWPLADYVTLNVSSPNTANLRALQHGDALRRLLGHVCDAAASLATRHGMRRPLALKLAPDLDECALDALCEIILEHPVEAVIATNTSIDRGGVATHVHAAEAGGLSGRPIAPLSRRVLGALAARLGSQRVLIAAGGIDSGAEASERLRLGASLVQLYTAFIYHGPILVREAIRSTR